MVFATARVAQTDPLPALSHQERQNWKAIGLVNMAGFRDKSSCTGTLVAPDLVLTAAHCLETKNGIKRTRHFVAGWDRGTFAAHRVSAQVFVHPEYFDAKGSERFKYDIAVMQLEEPIKTTAVMPLLLSDVAALRLGELAVLGYHRKRPNVINGRFDCSTISGSAPSVVLLDCEVISGNSGGPVLAAVGDGWKVVAVIAGRVGGPSPRTLAVPLGDWVMAHWRDALMRADPEGHEG
ncbi:MAG: serine protease [Paracoccaceae bacterium]|nr:serine protease [Paracoccaceae bacterium]